jgi:transcriptional regulator with XRE-family HTH domain
MTDAPAESGATYVLDAVMSCRERSGTDECHGASMDHRLERPARSARAIRKSALHGKIALSLDRLPEVVGRPLPHLHRPWVRALQKSGQRPFDHKVMDIGGRLRHARESQGLTLRQVGDITKLSMTTLVRIEANEFDTLPGGILIKGYLRAYAAAVGIVPEDIVREYLARYANEGATALQSELPPNERRRSWSRIVVLAVAVIAAAVAYFCQTRSAERIGGSPAVHAVRPMLDVTPPASAGSRSAPTAAGDPSAVPTRRSRVGHRRG